jgi:hypothetical protein
MRSGVRYGYGGGTFALSLRGVEEAGVVSP